MNAVVITCSWCGSADHEAHESKTGRCWMGCNACGARTAAYGERRVGRSVLTGKERAVAAWSRKALRGPPQPERRAAPARMLRAVEDGDSVLELLARMLVPTSYRVPVEGRSTKAGMLMTDVAGALGFIRGRLAKEVAMAVVTRAEAAGIAKVTQLAERKVKREVMLQAPRPLDLNKPDDRWRLNLVVFDATHELVWPERRRPYAQLARLAKMRKHNYIVVHRCATHVLQEALSKARTELREKISRG